MKFAYLIICLFLLAGCNPEEEKTAAERIFDPKVPGGTSLKNPKTQEVIGLSGIVEFDKVTLSWRNPSIYIGQNFKIHVYRILGNGTSFTLPDPNVGGNSAFLYYPRLDFTPFQAAIYVDQNTTDLYNLIVNETYTYYVLVEKDGVFSTGQKLTVTIPERGSQVTIPSQTDFWKNYASRVGGKPDATFGTIYMDTLDAGIPSLTRNNGNMVYARNGTVLFISDTENNRVMVYTNPMGKMCYDNFVEGSIEFDICIALNGMAPLTPYAVLGQPDFSTDLSCQDPGNTMDSAQCLTSPTGLTVKNNILFVSDNGNNRVKIYDTLPIFGCYNFKKMLGDSTPSECTPSRVIGKRGVTDLTNYSLLADGDVALSCPNGLEIYNNNLYIADTCNNRVVLAKNAALPSLFECNNVNWKTSKCVFAGQIGQASLFEADSFDAQWTAGNFTYDFVGDNTQGDQNYLRRHLAHPSIIKIKDNKMFIAGNENFSRTSVFGDLTLYGRILRFDTMILEGSFPACTDASFLIGGCDANWVYGQRGFTKIPVTPFGGNYMDATYTLTNIGGFDLFGDRMFATDSEENIVSIWTNAFDNTVPGSPANSRIYNPLGVWDADLGRAQPDLKGLSALNFRQNLGGLVIFDSGSHYYYLIKIYNPIAN